MQLSMKGVFFLIIKNDVCYFLLLLLPLYITDTVSILLPILVVAAVCTIFVAIVVYRNKQKEAKYNSTVRYSAVQKDKGGGRVYDDVTTEL